MKLSDYFHQQHEQKLSSQTKNLIFSRIQKEKLLSFDKPSTISSKRFIFAAKKIHYISLASLIVLFVFWWVFFDKIIEKDFWFMQISQWNVSNWVIADYVAEIIDFNWEYSIIHWGETVSYKNIDSWLSVASENKISIENGEIVKMKEWTEMIFTLVDWTQARIDWPAEFSINYENGKYQILINDWKFFRIFCPECESDFEIITSETLIQQEKDQKLDIQIANDWWDIIVKNDGDPVVISTRKDEKNSSPKILTSETVSIDANLESFDVLDDSDLMSIFKTKNNISWTFTISRDEIQWPQINKESVSKEIVWKTDLKWNPSVKTQVDEDLNIEETQNNETNNIENEKDDLDRDPILEWIFDVVISDQTDTIQIDNDVIEEFWLVSGWQKIPTENQSQILKSNLNSFFLTNTFEDIYMMEKRQQWILNLAEHINNIAISFWYTDHANADLSSIKTVIHSLKQKLQQDRYIAPSYLSQLDKISNRCDELSSHYSAWDGEDLEHSRKKIQENLPYYLKLM